MENYIYLESFIDAARKVGAEVIQLGNLNEAAQYVASKSQGTALVPDTVLSEKHGLKTLLTDSGVDVFAGSFRSAGHFPAAGVTFSNFAMADTGTVVLNSTEEDVRLATTLPENHFVIVDPVTILEDNLAAVTPMTEMHQGTKSCFVAYITGPSRTADIERVLTIGCHGPRKLHILIVESVSTNIMEM